MIANRAIDRKRRVPPKSITVNACTACQQKRVKCDGKTPCSTCIHGLSSVCTYKAHTRLVKEEMRCEINELRERVVLSTQILDALASGRHVSTILRGLEEQQDLGTIARSIATSKRLQVGTDSRLKAIEETEEREEMKRAEKMCKTDGMEVIEKGEVMEEMEGMEATEKTEATEATEESFNDPKNNDLHADCIHPSDWLTLNTRKEPCQWNSALPDSLLIKHLISLYWVWDHPAYPILDMPRFLEHYEAGMKKYCSPLLVSAICIAACDVLDPYWECVPGRSTNVSLLRQNLAAEAVLQEVLADPGAETTTQALAIMSVVNNRAKETS